MNFLRPDNHLFELARSGRRLPHGVLAVVLSFVIVLAAQIAGGIPAVLIIFGLKAAGGEPLPGPDALDSAIMPSTALEQVVFLILPFAPIFLLLWAWLALFEKRPFWTIGLERDGAAWKYGRGLLVGLVLFSIPVGLMALPGYVAVETESARPQGPVALGGVLFVLLGWIVQGAAEEALTRGWLLPVIGGRYKPVLGLLLSALVFAIYHSLNPGLNPLAVLNLFLFGIFTALYALYEGGLWGVFSIHTVWNWAQGNLFGFEVSGVEPAGGMLINLMEAGPDAVTGGAFGPEGGLAVTAVLIAGSAVVWLLGQRREAQPGIV